MLKKLNEQGRLGVAIAIIILCITWGFYVSYLVVDLKDFVIPMVITGGVLIGGLIIYWLYQIEDES